MEESIFVDIILPASLIIIMIGLGMSLTLKDFKRVALAPRPAIVGLISQLVLLPAVGFGLAFAFGLSPVWAVGLVLISACPGGPTSNLITFVSRGDTALSISLTAVSSAVTVVTIPLWLSVSIAVFGVDAEAIRSPVGQIILHIVAITAIPVSVGLLIRHFRSEFADRMRKPVRIASAVIFLVVLAAIIVDQRQVLFDYFFDLAVVTAALNVSTMALGFAFARVATLNMKQSITISIETGIQNGTLAIVIAMSILGASDIAVPPAIYSLLMFFSGGALMYYFGVVKSPAAFDRDVQSDH